MDAEPGTTTSPAELFPTQPLEERTDPVAELLAPDHAHVGHPVQLNHPARTFKGMEAMPSIGIVAKHQKRAFIRRDFRDHVFQAVGPAQQAQAAGLRFPGIVHIDQHRHQLGARVGVDLAVARRRYAACRYHGGAALKLHAQLFLHRAREFRPLDRRDQGGERGAIFQRGQRERTRMGHQRIVGIDRRHGLRSNEMRHQGERKRLARGRRGIESVKVYGQGGHGTLILPWRRKRKICAPSTDHQKR